MNDQEQRNLLIALVLVFAIIFAWQALVPKPAPHVAPPAPSKSAGIAGMPGAGVAAPAAATRAQALAREPRLPIETPRLRGSISLTGARLDDLALIDYHETIDPKSPAIILLSPAGAPHAYMAETGWIAQDPKIPVPGNETLWQAPAGAKLTPATPVTLTWDNGAGLKFTRTISVDDDYMFTVRDSVVNSGAAVALMPYALSVRAGPAPTTSTFISYEGPLGGFDTGAQTVKYSSLHQDEPIERQSTGGWVGFTDKYWLTAVAPADQHTAIDARFSHFASAEGEKFQADWLGPTVTVDHGGSTSAASYIFAGAKEVKLLGRYEDTLGLPHFDTAVDWGWFFFLTKPVFYVLDFIYGRVGNFGIAILILTVLVRALFFPLANKQFASMAKMKAMAPEMQRLRETFADDKVRLQQETVALYRRTGVNPLMGCLPVLLQIPVFFSLYKVLYVSIEMRHAPFYGWIHDLSAPDPTSLFNLFGLLPFTPPSQLMIGALPVLYAATMFLQQRMQPPMPDPVQARMFQFMPIVLGVTLARSPAGLLIYWTWSMLLTMTQQWVITRRMKAAAPAPA